MKTRTIKSLDDLETRVTESSRVLCLYSGGLDGSYLLHALRERCCARILALSVGVGGDITKMEIEQRGKALGVDVIVVDAREEFVRDFIAPAIAAQASYLGMHPICASLSRPLMAKVAYEIAVREGFDVVLHTSNRSQNSLRRFNGALAALGFEGDFGSPFEESTISRETKQAVLLQAGISLPSSGLFSTDTNLWGREFEYGALDDPEKVEVPEFLYRWTMHPLEENTREVSLEFRAGRPVAFNSTEYDLLTLIRELNVQMGRFGVGRYVALEEIEGGRKVQEVREMPAAAILFDGYRRIEAACLSSECVREKMSQEQLWVREATEGRWFGSLRSAAQSFIEALAKEVTGRVSYRVNSSRLQLTSVIADKPLYVRNRDVYESVAKQ